MGHHEENNVFTDAQVKRIREIIRDENYIYTGKVTARLLLLAFGALSSLAVGAILAYLGLKK